MKRMLCAALILALLVCSLPCSALAADTLHVQFAGSFDNTIDYNGKLDLQGSLGGSTALYSNDLAVLSELLSSNMYARPNPVLTALGFSSYRIYDNDRKNDGTDNYKTAYGVAEKTVVRNGKDCTLLLCLVGTASNGNSIRADLDFLNYEMTGKNTDLSSKQALTFTEAAKLIYDGKNSFVSGSGKTVAVASEVQNGLKGRVQELKNSGKDYLVLVLGQSRGGAVGNYLSKLLIDEFGTQHVTAYLTNVPNLDRDAADKTKNTSKYRSIFNLVNPDDVICTVPLGTGQSGWGFARWGVDLIFETGEHAEGTALFSKMKEYYAELLSDASSDDVIFVDSQYHYYQNGEGNGKAIAALEDQLASVIASPQAYYTGKVSIVQSGTVFSASGKEGTKQYVVPFSFITSAWDTIDTLQGQSVSVEMLNGISDYLCMARGTFYYKCDMQALMRFLLKHLVGADDFDTFVKDNFGSTIIAAASNYKNAHIQLLEVAMGHMPETTLAWLMAEKELGQSAFQTVHYGSAAEAVNENTVGGVTVLGKNCLYSDQTLLVTGKDGVFTLCLTDEALRPCEPYGPVTLCIAADTGIRHAYFFTADGESLSFAVDAADGQAEIPLDSLNGTLILTDRADGVYLSGAGQTVYVTAGAKSVKDCVLYVAAYDENGRMRAVEACALQDAAAQSFPLKNAAFAGAATVETFLLDADYRLQ